MFGCIYCNFEGSIEDVDIHTVECKKIKNKELRSQLDLDVTALETRPDVMTFNRDQTVKELQKISTDLSDNRKQISAIMETTSLHEKTIDDISDGLEHLTKVVSRLTKVVMDMVDKNTREE